VGGWSVGGVREEPYDAGPAAVAAQSAAAGGIGCGSAGFRRWAAWPHTYARLSNQLPGPNTAAHRKLMAEAFARLQEILPMLEGPTPGAEFRQQMQVISDAQAELATGPAELSPEPTIDTGLRAARDVLSSITHAAYYERAELTPLFGQLAVKINELDTVRGPLHQVYVGDAVGITSQIITKMADVLGQRLAEQNGSSQPTTRPTTPTQTSGG